MNMMVVIALVVAVVLAVKCQSEGRSYLVFFLYGFGLCR